MPSLQQTIGVTRIADVTSLDRAGIRVCCAIRPGGHILQVSNGKGVHAEVGALSEAAELWAAEQAEPERWVFRNGRAWMRAQRLDVDGPLEVQAQTVWCLPPGSPSMGLMDARWTSNGLAAHPQLDAAVLHGLLEVVEREALPDDLLPSIAKRSVPVPFEVPGFLLRAFDLTPRGCPVPVAAAVLVDLEGGPNQLTAGYAARLDATDAVHAACEEAFQSRLTDIQGAREDTAIAVEHEVPEWLVKATPRGVMSRSRCRSLPQLVRALKRPVAVVELVPGRLPLKVVKVIVPGFGVSRLLT